MFNRIPTNIRNNKKYYKVISASSHSIETEEIVMTEEVISDVNNNINEDNMIVMNESTVEKIDKIIKNKKNDNVKTVKKDRGLIERVESSKVILTEDNKQLLKD